ncbi:C-terminal binding protein [Caproiciproducens faecalis]|uniref:C-terminal binding protein n=1 Tax=Caproiciproducens faecalis TaxID=2820301 RepID=A0ABS7DJH2_9FIRM|nr:C-terminal binding protein [Caproiciproducens faecalis]MBW7571428.1 C-terminal binding protein [Caproiciproducens faecalis]
MANRNLVAITDCDHDSIAVEAGVLKAAGLEAPWLQCKTEDDLIRECVGFKSVINQYAPFTEKVFENLPDLKVIVRYGVGVDNIDLKAASKHGVKVCNVPDYGMYEVADHAMALALALARKIVFNNDNVKNGIWEYQKAIPIYRLSTQTVGVIGVGRIGTAFAERAKAFGMKVLAYDEYAQKTGRTKDYMEMVGLDELLERSDIISVHCPLDGNRDLIAAAQLEKMKSSAYLINVSRGGIINEQDLFSALSNQKIAGAACDVFSPEPIAKDNPLLSLPNFLATPHIAWYSEESAIELERKVAEEAARGALDQPLLNVVNTDVGK